MRMEGGKNWENKGKAHMLQTEALLGWRTLLVTTCSSACARATLNCLEENTSLLLALHTYTHTTRRIAMILVLQLEVHDSIMRCVT